MTVVEKPTGLVQSPRGPSEEPFRIAMRGCASTVAIVASEEDGVAAGIVVTAVMSLAMDPPSLTIAINRSSSCHDVFVRRRCFSVNFLAGEHADIASKFHGSSARERFRNGSWSVCDSADPIFAGVPYLADAQANVFCLAEDVIEAHTHTLLIGRVKDVRLGASMDPLLYCAGQYGRFGSININ